MTTICTEDKAKDTWWRQSACGFVVLDRQIIVIIAAIPIAHHQPDAGKNWWTQAKVQNSTRPLRVATSRSVVIEHRVHEESHWIISFARLVAFSRSLHLTPTISSFGFDPFSTSGALLSDWSSRSRASTESGYSQVITRRDLDYIIKTITFHPHQAWWDISTLYK